MKYTIGIQPDDYGNGDSYSTLWERFLKDAGHTIKEINVYRADIFEQLSGCHGFMWRHGHLPDMRQIARRLLPVIEKALKMIVYPDQNTCWHYDDKIIQRYLLEASKIPIPKTWIWYDRHSALGWAKDAIYPLVLKLWSGTSSDNVCLLSSFMEAEHWINRLFGEGVYSLVRETPKRWPLKKRLKVSAKILIDGYPVYRKPSHDAWELHKNYILFQEFLHGNQFDYRIVVIGNRAFAFRRFNRPNDFRASGGGNTDTDPANVDLRAVRLGFRVAKALNTHSIGSDILLKNDEFVVSEISYTFPHWTVHKCPGHWELKGEPKTGELLWSDGSMWPEEAQIADFLCRLNSFYQS